MFLARDPERGQAEHCQPATSEKSGRKGGDRMEHHPEDQGVAPDRIQGVQPILGIWVSASVVDIRHRSWRPVSA